ncbi:MAG: LysR family transcriptional regulator [Burkholderiales bacterium]|nr:LysR family transcriptional regulator [Burkholderiales bacterium]
MAFHFDLVDLRLMVRIAEHNSLTKGADAAHLSVPAASMRVKSLESSSGLQLLYRSSQGVTLTAAGRTLVQHAKAILFETERLNGDLQEYTQGIQGHLRIFASTTAIGEFLPAVLRQYLLTHPDVSVDLREHASPEVVRAVSEGQTDIGVFGGEVPTGNLELLPYREDSLVLVVPAKHPLAGRSAIAFAETLEHDHVGLLEGSSLHQYLLERSHAADRRYKLRIQVGSFEAACRMIEAGVGVGIMQRLSAERYSRWMDIGVVALGDDWALRKLRVCVRSRGSLPLFAQDLVDLLVEDARAAAGAG